MVKRQMLEMLPAQKNVENMMMAYQEKELCNMGGYFVLASKDEAEKARLMMKMIPIAHGALQLRYGFQGKMFLAMEREKTWIPVYECAEEGEIEKQKRFTEWLQQPFQENGPLYGFAVFHFSDNTWYGCEKFHHLIMDKASLLLLIQWQRKALADISNVGKEQWESKIVTDTRYLDMMHHVETPVTSENQAKDWLARNFHRERKIRQEHRVSLSADAKSVVCSIPLKLWRAVHKMSEEKQISAESIWCLAICLEHCLCLGTNQTVIGRITEYRKRNQKDIVGLFSRILPISYVIQQGDASKQCRYLMEQFFVSLRYGEYSLAKLNSLDKEADIRFDVVISYHPQRLSLERQAEYRELPNNCIDTSLRIWINDEAETPELILFYQTEYYTKKEITARSERYLRILDQICSQKSPAEISLLTEADKRAYHLVHAEPKVAPVQTVVQRFLKRGIDGKDAARGIPLLIDENHTWDYEQSLYVFYQSVDWLEKHHVSFGDIVGLCCPRSVMLPILMLAVLYMKAAFLPIILKETEERRRRLTKDCRIVIGEKEIEEIWGLEIDLDIQNRAEREREKVYEKEFLQNQCAYVLYTSGSTGEPKAVQISMYSLMCRLEWMYRKYGCRGLTLQKTPYTFDVSVWEILLAPAYGGSLYLMGQDEERLPDRIAEIIIKRKINRVHFVPSMLGMFLQYWEQERLCASRTNLMDVFVSGEVLSDQLTEKVFRLFPSVRLVNLYGPTECTIDVSYHECKPGEKEIPIGRAVANTELYVMAPDHYDLLPVGVPGELCICGDLGGMGYKGNEQGGYGEYDGKKIYRTGDMAQLGSDGEIYYLGRMDEQKKLRGMRIDTGIVERILLRHPQIRMAYAIVREHHLEAYYEADADIAGLRNMLSEDLPFYNIPTQWYRVSFFPLNRHGKLDTEKLFQQVEKEKIARTTLGSSEFTNEEQRLAELIESYSSLVIVSPDDNLMEAGLDSLAAMQIVGALREKGFSCSYAVIYQHPTVRHLLAALGENAVLGQPKGLDYLFRHGQVHLLLCVPYGGGESEIYGEMARHISELPWDMAVVRMADFEEKTVGAIAMELAGELRNYSEFTIIGYCVGSALAIALSAELQKQKKKIDRVYLAASLPSHYYHIGRKKFCAWDFMSDAMIRKFLLRLNRGAKEADILLDISQFRKDVRRYFDFMEKTPKKMTNISVTLLFGGCDPLTRKWRRQYQRWNQYFEGKKQICVIKTAGHYFLSESAELLGRVLQQNHNEVDGE